MATVQADSPIGRSEMRIGDLIVVSYRHATAR